MMEGSEAIKDDSTARCVRAAVGFVLISLHLGKLSKNRKWLR